MPGRRKNDIDPAVAAANLLDNVLKKNYTEAEELIAKGVKPDYVQKTGDTEETLKLRTVLHHCVEAGNLEALEWIVGKGANPNVSMEKGVTALHMCVLQDKVAVLQKMCDLALAGSFRFSLDVSKKNNAGESAMQCAIRLYKVDLARILLKAGANHNFNEYIFEIDAISPLINHMQYACCKGNLELAETLSDLGVTVFQRDIEGNTLVHLAVRHKQWAILEWLLEKGCSLNVQGCDGRTVLSSMFEEGWGLEAVTQLVQRGAEVNEKDLDGTPLLHRSVLAGDEALVASLLENAAQIYATDLFGNTSVHIAAQLMNTKILHKLTTADDKKAVEIAPNTTNNDGNTALHAACQMDQYHNVVHLLSLPGINQNLQNAQGCTPLHLASAHGAVECAKALLLHNNNKEADPPAKKPPPKGKKDALVDEGKKTEMELEDNEGNTALQVAMEHSHPDVVKLLIDSQASVQRTSKLHGTLLHQAVFSQAHDIMRSLVAGGASVHERDKDDCTPLHIAVGTGCLESVVLLLEAGADIACQDEHTGSTPLHMATTRGLDKIVACLFKNNAAAEVRDLTCMTPLHHAAACGSAPSVLLVLDNGGKANATDITGQTALHYACKHDHAAVVKLLLLRGADFTLKDKDGWSPVHVSANAGSTESAKHLIQAGAAINEADKKDRLPLTLASESCKIEVARLLVGSWMTRNAAPGQV